MTKGFTLTLCTGISATVAPFRPISNVPPGMSMNSGVNVTRFGGGSFAFGFSGGGLLATAGVGVERGQKTQAPIPAPSSKITITAAIAYGSKFFFEGATAG